MGVVAAPGAGPGIETGAGVFGSSDFPSQAVNETRAIKATMRAARKGVSWPRKTSLIEPRV